MVKRGEGKTCGQISGASAINAASAACPAKPALAAYARRFPNEFSSTACSNIVEALLRASRAQQAGGPSY
jgi:hypothetical protein